MPLILAIKQDITREADLDMYILTATFDQVYAGYTRQTWSKIADARSNPCPNHELAKNAPL